MDTTHSTGKPLDPEQEQTRRGFLKGFFAGLTALIAGILPPLAGLGVLLDPLRRKAETGRATRITELTAIPPDGIPRKFPVRADHRDAWNRFKDVPIGAVYVLRRPDDRLEAFNVSCPHAGCFVEYRSGDGDFLCPCHNSRFGLDGSVTDPKSPSPRGLDSLEVELRNESEVWVTFQNFAAGHAEKTPVT